jgi:hypothetical protein
MSYDLAVREGERPANDRTAGRVFTDLFDRYLETKVCGPPTERLTAYVAALVKRWGDVTEDVEDASPWSAGPLIGGAGGPLVCFPMHGSRAEEVSAWAAALAESTGLVCFDPQQNRLRP